MLKKIFRFIITSTNQHGVHSPFVYQLVTKCFYAKTTIEIRKSIKEYTNVLLNNHSLLKVTDLGSGSKQLKSNSRKVSSIVKTAGSSKKYAFLLNRLVKYLNVSTALELGTSLGVSSYAMVLNNAVKLDTIEGCKQTLNTANKNFNTFDVHHKINSFQGDFDEVLSKLLNKQSYDLIFFDGNHKKEPTLAYFNKCLNYKHNDSVFIFDDIYWSDEMTEAWEIIKNHKEVTVTVDIFKWGLVFFRKEQQKEHFKIRV